MWHGEGKDEAVGAVEYEILPECGVVRAVSPSRDGPLAANAGIELGGVCLVCERGKQPLARDEGVEPCVEHTLGRRWGVSSPVEIKLYGPELAALEQYGAHLATALESVDGLEDVYDDVSEPAAELEMHVNGAEADKVGLTPAAVSEAVSGALLGVSAGEMHLADRALAVRVRAPDAIRFDPALLSSLPILPPGGARPVPLGSIARFVPTETRAELWRENQQQMIGLTADVSGTRAR